MKTKIFIFIFAIFAVGIFVYASYDRYQKNQAIILEAQRQQELEDQQVKQHEQAQRQIAKMLDLCNFTRIFELEQNKLNLAGDDVERVKMILINMAESRRIGATTIKKDMTTKLAELTEYREQHKHDFTWDEQCENFCRTKAQDYRDTILKADEIIDYMDNISKRLNSLSVE